MNDTETYIFKKYNLIYGDRAPIEIPNMDRDHGLAPLFNELGFKTGVEIGTEAGTYAEVLCRSIPGLKLSCVDMWQVYAGYRDYNSKEQKLVNSEQKAKDRLKNYDVTFIKKYSMDAVKDFKDLSLDFCYIDANHELPWVVEDIWFWEKKVKHGGIIALHDYYRTKSKNSRCHVVAAIHAFTSARFVYPWFIVGSKAMIPGQYRDHSRSCFFVKE